MSATQDPDVWFVDPASASLGNQVTPYVDGLEMMTAMYEQISQLQDGDFCFVGAWKMSGYMQLPGSELALVDHFLTALENGADVRLLLWRGTPGSPIITSSGPVTHRGLHLRLKRSLDESGGQVIVDNKHPNVGSHHHKYAIFGKQASAGVYELTAFVGGIDLVDDRRDDAGHALEVLKGYTGWHDVHVKVQGPAAEAIWLDFVRRWNDFPDEASYLKTATTRLDPNTYLFQVPALSNPVHRVEALFTYHCSHFTRPHATVETVYYDFAPPGGINTNRSAYLNAISLAEHYIYIENQYFFDVEIASAIRDRLIANETVHVFVLMPEMATFDRHYRNACFDIVREAPGAADRFHPCEPHHDSSEPVAGPIYVHAKMMIVDDVYVSVGSANFSPRSMTHDSEINVGVFGVDLIEYTVDGQDGSQQRYTVSSSIRDLRVRLWAEHLQTTPPEENTDEGDPEDDPLLFIPTAITTFLTSIGVSPSRVRDVDPSGGLPNPFWNILMHPSQSCGMATTTDGGDTGEETEAETENAVR
ncbi:MAG: hypothetical protein IT323_00455 [Anaerolineae bacterium]|nr:hypothetical protein [Anaerolineae bacterium]